MRKYFLSKEQKRFKNAFFLEVQISMINISHQFYIKTKHLSEYLVKDQKAN